MPILKEGHATAALCVCVGGGGVSGVRRQLAEVISLLLNMWAAETIVGSLAWRQGPLPIKPSCQSPKQWFLLNISKEQ